MSRTTNVQYAAAAMFDRMYGSFAADKNRRQGALAYATSYLSCLQGSGGSLKRVAVGNMAYQVKYNNKPVPSYLIKGPLTANGNIYNGYLNGL